MQSEVNTKLVTLTFHMIETQKEHKDATGDFTLLLSSIQTACKFISSKVRKAGLANIYGLVGNINTSGDIQKKLDIIANKIFINSLKSSNQVCALLSEEVKDPIYLNSSGKYIVSFDPLDGSSNIDANITIGSIFGIWKKQSLGNIEFNKDILQKGSDLIASGYCVYGSSTQLITCVDRIVNGFTLDPSLGEFILTHPKIKIKDFYPIYSINEGNSIFWDEAISEYVSCKKNPKIPISPFSLRYVGSMVADVHRTLIYGGIFLYPLDSKNIEGKLRLMYECNPLAYIIEAAGGKAITGKIRILDIQPIDIHQKCPIIIGSRINVEEVEYFYEKVSN